MKADPETEELKKSVKFLKEKIEDFSGSALSIDCTLPESPETAELPGILNGLASCLSSVRSREALISEIIRRINLGISFEEIMNYVYDSFREIIPYNRIGVSILSADGTLRSVWVRSEQSVRLTLTHQSVLKGSSLESIIFTGKPRIINDLEEYYRSKPESESTRILLEEGILSSLTCPLIAMGRPVGFIFFSSTKKNTYIQAHAGLYEKIAGHLSVAIERSRLYDSMAELTKKTENQNKFIKKILGRYVSDEVMNAVLENPEMSELGGERRKMTLLMSDLRGYSALVESLEPEQSISILNDYLKRMVDVIDLFAGTINEIIGDGILVIFGAPRSTNDDSLRAVACAAAMQQALVSLNQENAEKGLPKLSMGIAVHTGVGVVGNIGSEKRARYGVVGSLVNLTGRFESVTTGGQVLISDSVYQECRPFIETKKSILVYAKGFREPFTLHELRSVTKDDITFEVPSDFDELKEMIFPVPVYFRFYEGKTLDPKPYHGRILMLSSDSAMIEILPAVNPLTDEEDPLHTERIRNRLMPGESLQIESVSYSSIQKEKREKRITSDMVLSERPYEKNRYLPPLDSKITDINDNTVTVKFTSLSPDAMQSLQNLLSLIRGKESD